MGLIKAIFKWKWGERDRTSRGVKIPADLDTIINEITNHLIPKLTQTRADVFSKAAGTVEE